jgi:hypothetical protein
MSPAVDGVENRAMADRRAPRADQVDEGTRLGSTTHVLARVVALPLRVWRATTKIWRRLASGVRATAVAWRRLVSGVLHVTGPLARACRNGCALLQRRLGRVVEWAKRSRLQVALLGGGVATLAMTACAFVAPQVATGIGYATVKIVGAGVVTAAALGAIGALGVGAAWLARHVTRLVGPALRNVGRSLASALAAALVAAGRGLGRVVAGVIRLATAIARPPARWASRRLCSIARAARAPARVIVQRLAVWASTVLRPVGGALQRAVHHARTWSVTAWRRVVYKAGVAFLRARHEMHAGDTPGAIPTTQPPAPSTRPSLPFDVEVHHNDYLPRRGTEVHAIIRVSAHDVHDSLSDSPEAAEVILLDCSGSMGQPWAKMRAARRATEAALDSLRDGTWFAIVRATHDARPVYPAAGLVAACEESRAAARTALRSVWPEGGTAMGEWLLLARELFATRPGTIRHVILLTDGKNESESRADLERAVEVCRGHFQCDCRGVGTEWEVAEVRSISSGLDGSVGIVADPAALGDDFRAMTDAAMAKRVAGTALRVWTPRGASVRFLQEVTPEVRRLSATRRVDAQSMDFPIGAWGDESRDYHLCIDVPGHDAGDAMLAARLSVVVHGEPVSTTMVKITWTEDETLSTRVDRRVAHYTGQAELADAIQSGLAARSSGDDLTATERLARAFALATESGNSSTLALLERVVDVDSSTGRVRLRTVTSTADEMALDVGSTKTVRVPVNQ